MKTEYAKSCEQIIEWFEEHEVSHYGKFDNVEVKLSGRPDLHAFIFLDQIYPRPSDMVSSAVGDQIWLDPKISNLVGKVNENMVIDLIRCGVMTDEDEYLYMFA